MTYSNEKVTVTFEFEEAISAFVAITSIIKHLASDSKPEHEYTMTEAAKKIVDSIGPDRMRIILTQRRSAVGLI